MAVRGAGQRMMQSGMPRGGWCAYGEARLGLRNECGKDGKAESAERLRVVSVSILSAVPKEVWAQQGSHQNSVEPCWRQWRGSSTAATNRLCEQSCMHTARGCAAHVGKTYRLVYSRLVQYVPEQRALRTPNRMCGCAWGCTVAAHCARSLCLRANKPPKALKQTAACCSQETLMCKHTCGQS